MLAGLGLAAGWLGSGTLWPVAFAGVDGRAADGSRPGLDGGCDADWWLLGHGAADECLPAQEAGAAIVLRLASASDLCGLCVLRGRGGAGRFARRVLMAAPLSALACAARVAGATKHPTCASALARRCNARCGWVCPCQMLQGSECGCRKQATRSEWQNGCIQRQRGQKGGGNSSGSAALGLPVCLVGSNAGTCRRIMVFAHALGSWRGTAI